MSTTQRISSDICSNKHKNNENSVQANLRLSPYKKALRTEVYEIILWDFNGLTCEEIARQLDKPVHSISGRISELKKQRKIKEVGTTKNSNGSTCSVYAAASNLEGDK